jgi:hypothetical protein
VPTDARITGIWPVTASADDPHLAKGQQLDVTPTKVQFRAHVENGDSGGPVYYRNADGTAVGITIRAADADGGTIAELIGPWLTHWSLSLDSS